jgi:hypothetical protein
MAFTQQIRHTGRIVLVHLAAMGFDKQLLRHFSPVLIKRVTLAACRT